MLASAVRVAVGFAVLVEFVSAWQTISVLDVGQKRKLLTFPVLAIAACMMFTTLNGRLLPVAFAFLLLLYWLGGFEEEEGAD